MKELTTGKLDDSFTWFRKSKEFKNFITTNDITITTGINATIEIPFEKFKANEKRTSEHIVRDEFSIKWVDVICGIAAS